MDLGVPEAVGRRVSQQISEMKQRLFVTDSLDSHIMRELQLRESNLTIRKPRSMDIPRELFEEPVVVGLERLAEGFVLRPPLLQQKEEATELRSSAGLSPHQVVHESPGFRVEEALPRPLVVLGRLLANRKQFLKGQHRLV